jgi:hypothetical protein
MIAPCQHIEEQFAVQQAIAESIVTGRTEQILKTNVSARKLRKGHADEALALDRREINCHAQCMFTISRKLQFAG